MNLTSNYLRAKFKSLGLNYQMIASEEIERLSVLLTEQLKAFENVSDFNTFTMELTKPLVKDGTKDLVGYIGAHKYVYFHIKGKISPKGDVKPFYHFKKRECISFNSDGFIGFCGEMDSTNSQPIYKAFDKWIIELANKR